MGWWGEVVRVLNLKFVVKDFLPQTSWQEANWGMKVEFEKQLNNEFAPLSRTTLRRSELQRPWNNYVTFFYVVSTRSVNSD